jgi:hypothetical protein
MATSVGQVHAAINGLGRPQQRGAGAGPGHAMLHPSRQMGGGPELGAPVGIRARDLAATIGAQDVEGPALPVHEDSAEARDRGNLNGVDGSRGVGRVAVCGERGCRSK